MHEINNIEWMDGQIVTRYFLYILFVRAYKEIPNKREGRLEYARAWGTREERKGVNFPQIVTKYFLKSIIVGKYL